MQTASDPVQNVFILRFLLCFASLYFNWYEMKQKPSVIRWFFFCFKWFGVADVIVKAVDNADSRLMDIGLFFTEPINGRWNEAKHFNDKVFFPRGAYSTVLWFFFAFIGRNSLTWHCLLEFKSSSFFLH